MNKHSLSLLSALLLIATLHAGAAVLKLLSPTGDAAGLTVSWQSAYNKTYFVQRSTNLAAQPAFVTFTNLPSQGLTTRCADPTATNAGPYFYRVGVQ